MNIEQKSNYQMNMYPYIKEHIMDAVSTFLLRKLNTQITI